MWFVCDVYALLDVHLRGAEPHRVKFLFVGWFCRRCFRRFFTTKITKDTKRIVVAISVLAGGHMGPPLVRLQAHRISEVKVLAEV